jgi:DNA-binding NarL/FixJ family response regulator
LRDRLITLPNHEATSLAQGIELYHQLSIDLVLLDLTLTDSSGVETVKRFRDAAKHIPLVVLTGSSQDNIGPQSLAAGADAFILKTGLTTYRIERAIFVTLSQRGRTQKLKA